MEFTKMHGLGNDFIVIENMEEISPNYKELAVRLCDRHQGIGADGLLIALPSKVGDIRMQVINADGSEAEMCGNGIRCFARYAYERGLLHKSKIMVETPAGMMEPEMLIQNGRVVGVRVNMGRPSLSRADIPMLGDEGMAFNEKLAVNGQVYSITSLLMGVPHTIVYVDNVDKVEICTIGKAIENHPVFPRKTNVNFVEIINPREIKVRTWERGAGATLACGTGCCASVVAAHTAGKTGNSVVVHLELGDLEIERKDDGQVFMTGPATEVFRGRIDF